MGELYETESVLQIALVTGLLGGGAAWLTGRAVARTWRPQLHAIGYMLLLGAAARFFHFALFQATLLSVPSYLADTGFFIVLAALSWQLTRVKQMITQYPWLYERAGPFAWRERATHELAATQEVPRAPNT
jgi:Domain of unknown function (DUF6867)